MSAAPANWSTPQDLRRHLLKLWEQGRLLACLVDPGELFPLRLPLKRPTSADLSERFDDVRGWARALLQAAGHGLRIELREVRHRVIGDNALPDEAWIDTLADALGWIGKQRDAQRFARLVERTRAEQPALLPWLRRQPLRALALVDDWGRLLDIVGWLRAHPRPGIYLRQVDLPGIHSKFVEAHRAVLSELLDRCLPADAIDASASGLSNFAQRYGFRAKPVRVRLRMLDPRQSLLGTAGDEDVTVDHATFTRIDPAASRVFVTENEINFLAFPALADSLVVFGAGYGFERLAEARWLHDKAIHYWGDLDTHGFAILDQLRGHFAHARSLLMDRATLLAHRPQWTDEEQPVLHDLPRLDDEERSLFDDLRWQRIEPRPLRLEQERVGFSHVERSLAALDACRQANARSPDLRRVER